MSTPEKLVLRDVSVMVDGTTLTRSARSVDVDTSADELAADTFGGDGWHEFEPGLKSGTITVEFYQGFDSGGVHETLWPLSESNDEFEIRIGPKGDAGASDNPVFVANVKLYAYKFLQGAAGELSPNPVTFRLTGAPSLNTT
jgi:hypothetical protein